MFQEKKIFKLLMKVIVYNLIKQIAASKITSPKNFKDG